MISEIDQEVLHFLNGYEEMGLGDRIRDGCQFAGRMVVAVALKFSAISDEAEIKMLQIPTTAHHLRVA